MKFRFHVVLGKKEEEVYSLVKVTRVLGIEKGILFEGMLQNYRFHVVQANNVTFDFSVADCLLMNLHHLLVVALIMKCWIFLIQVKNKEDFLNGLGHLKVFMKGYFWVISLN